MAARFASMATVVGLAFPGIVGSQGLNGPAVPLADDCQTFQAGRDESKFATFRQGLLASGSGMILLVEGKGAPALRIVASALVFLGETAAMAEAAPEHATSLGLEGGEK